MGRGPGLNTYYDSGSGQCTVRHALGTAAARTPQFHRLIERGEELGQSCVQG